MLPENRDAVALMQVCATQWRIAATGQRIGYDYAGVRVAAELSGIVMDQMLFDKLRVIEAAYLQADRDRRERETREHGHRSPSDPIRRHRR